MFYKYITCITINNTATLMRGLPKVFSQRSQGPSWFFKELSRISAKLASSWTAAQSANSAFLYSCRREWGRGRGSRLQGGKLHDKLIMHSAGLFAALAESLLSANSCSRSEGCVWITRPGQGIAHSSPCRILRSVRRRNKCLGGLAGGCCAVWLPC